MQLARLYLNYYWNRRERKKFEQKVLVVVVVVVLEVQMVQPNAALRIEPFRSPLNRRQQRGFAQKAAKETKGHGFAFPRTVIR